MGLKSLYRHSVPLLGSDKAKAKIGYKSCARQDDSRAQALHEGRGTRVAGGIDTRLCLLIQVLNCQPDG